MSLIVITVEDSIFIHTGNHHRLQHCSDSTENASSRRFWNQFRKPLKEDTIKNPKNEDKMKFSRILVLEHLKNILYCSIEPFGNIKILL